jgi:hypothetical protein
VACFGGYDGQAAMAEGYIAIDEKAFIVRTAMALCIGHLPNQPFDFGACVMIDDACDRAHGLISADDMEK